MIDAAITDEVRALERLDLEGLRAEWRQRYGSPPTLRSPDLLRRDAGLADPGRRLRRLGRPPSGGRCVGSAAAGLRFSPARDWRGSGGACATRSG